MNTDNCTISGETIDYGPCAFMDVYNPSQVFSSIDRMGRYAYDNQPGIIVWNLAQLATALIQQLEDPQEAVEEATEIVHAMPGMIEREWLSRFAAKIGIARPQTSDMTLIEDLLERMAAGQADFTNTFRALSGEAARDQFIDPEAFDGWADGWRQRLEAEENPKTLMQQVNPAFIPRNHRMEEMIAAAVSGNMALFERMNTVLSRPYEDQPEHADLQNPPKPDEVVPATFCGT
jgi:uncharacterized protein YdiU (UPF0061 family)